MSRASEAANSVVAACIDVARYYCIPVYRQQSLALPGAGRPIPSGIWYDTLGQKQTKGKADLLLTPCIDLNPYYDCLKAIIIAVPLWVECKHGTGRLSPEQKYFKAEVEKAGAFYLLCHDSADALWTWLKDHNVERGIYQHYE